MEKRWYSASELLNEWDMQPFELINLIRQGKLQPYAKVAEKEKKIRHELSDDEIHYLIDSVANFKNIPNELLERISPDIQREHFNEESFENGIELQEFLDKLIFKAEDINNCDVRHGIDKITPKDSDTPAPAQLTQEHGQTFIKSLSIAYISPTEISIKSGEEKAGDYDCGDIGFKESEKTWQMFIKVLRDSDHKFQTGIYSKDKSAIKNRNYNSRAKLTTNFSKKFVSFLNQKFNAELPESFNVFKNMKGLDRAGTYEPKFRIIDRRNSDNNKEIKKMSQEDTVRKIEELSKQRKSEKDDTKKTMLLIEIGKYADHAKRNNYITEEWFRRIISQDDSPTDNDIVSLFSDITEKDKHSLF